nr:cytochrome P450 82C4-like [Ipomoea batatas]
MRRWAFSTYDSYWRKVRKMVVVEIAIQYEVWNKLKHVGMWKLTSNVKELYNHIVRNGGDNGAKVDMNEWMRHLNYNMISKIVMSMSRRKKESTGDVEDRDFIDVMLSVIDDEFHRRLPLYTRKPLLRQLQWYVPTAGDLVGDNQRSESDASYVPPRLPQGFDLSPRRKTAVDMSEALGIKTMPRANPLEAVLTPRLPSPLQVHLVRTLGGLADKYGPVFTIRIGMPRALVVSRWEAVKDCFGTYDKIFASRPASCAGTYLGYDNAALAFSTYDSYWRKVRKMVVVELLSSTKLEKLKHVWMSELTSNVKELYNHIVKNGGDNGVKVDMNEWMRHLNYNMISKIVVGRRYKFTIEHGIEDEEARHMRKAFKEFMSLAGELVSADALPFRIFRWLDFEGHIKNMKASYSDYERVSSSLDR